MACCRVGGTECISACLGPFEGCCHYLHSVQFSHSIMFDSATPWTAACQAYLSITNSQSLLKLMSIESVMPSSHLILCHPLLLLPSILPSIRVFSNESTLCRRWPKYWNFIFSISPSNEYSVLIPVLPSLMILIIFLWLALLDYLYLSSFLAVALGIDPCL